jgi:hypothetical protein
MASLRPILFSALVAVGIAAAGGPVAAAGAEADVAAAEALARRTWYEGVPQDAAHALGEAGVERLIALLADPAEAVHHGQIIEVLGMTGHPKAYIAVAAAGTAVGPSERAVDRAERRLRVAILVALGHLARDDDRALDDLEAAVSRGPGTATPGEPANDRALSNLLRRSAVSALALSGRPEARTALQRLAREAGAEPEFVAHVRAALDEHARVADAVPHAGPHERRSGRGNAP